MKLNKKSENDKSEKIKYNVLFVPDSDTAAVKIISIQLEYIMAFLYIFIALQPYSNIVKQYLLFFNKLLIKNLIQNLHL